MVNRLYAVPVSIGITHSYNPVKTDPLHYWFQVRSVEETHREKVVYHITFEEDNSYVAGGMVVQSCLDMPATGMKTIVDWCPGLNVACEKGIRSSSEHCGSGMDSEKC